MNKKINITKDMFMKYIEVNKTNCGKKLDFDTFKRSGLDAQTYIYIADHEDELRRRYLL